MMLRFALVAWLMVAGSAVPAVADQRSPDCRASSAGLIVPPGNLREMLGAHADMMDCGSGTLPPNSYFLPVLITTYAAGLVSLPTLPVLIAPLASVVLRRL